MAKIIKQWEWNHRFYANAELDNGSRIELKSETGKDFEELLVKYNDLSKAVPVDPRQAELDAYAVEMWPTLAKEAEKQVPMTTEKTASEWIAKAAKAVLTTAGVKP
jgi:hypothetical protein